MRQNQLAWILAVTLLATASWAAPKTRKPAQTPTDSEQATKPSNGPSFAEAQPEDITNENFPELIESFDYPNADITEVVKAISKLTGKNFILDPAVRGKITIIAPTQITVAEAYRAFLSALAINSLTVVPSGNFLKIRQSRAAQRDSIETYSGPYYPNTDQMITRIIKLKYISAEEVHKNLRMLSSKDGDINPYAPTNSLIVSDYGTSIERIVSILNELDVPGFEEQLAVIRIKYAKAKDIADLIDQIINKGDDSSRRGGIPRFRRARTQDTSPSAGGAESYSLVVADDRTNSIIVVGNKAGTQKIRGLVNKLDFPLRPEDAGGIYVYHVRHGEAEKIADVLNGIASEAKKQQDDAQGGRSGGDGVPRPPIRTEVSGDTTATGAVFGGDISVTADKVTNSLIITAASRQDYEVVRNLLRQIDIPRDQVFVKAIIMEMSTQKATQWGVDYYKFVPETNGAGRIGFRSSNNLASLLSPEGDQGLTIGFGSSDTMKITPPGGGAEVTVSTLSGLISFIKTNVGGNVLSTPQIMGLDNEEAVIEVGQTVPVGQTESTTGSTTSVSTQFEKATIKLTITPYISPDTDSVRLKIDQKVKQLSDTSVKASELAKSAVVTNDRSIETTIVLDSGDTAILGGLMTDQESENVKKVPVLGDIPILGWLFKSKSVSKDKHNLVMFITPKIIRSAQDSAELLNSKLNERLEFIQRNLGGRDPHGAVIDQLPRKALSEVPLEEPAAETF